MSSVEQIEEPAVREYIESVGCKFDPALRLMIDEGLREKLAPYFVAQDKWGGMVLRAAGAESQYVSIMGKSSRKERTVGRGILQHHDGFEGYGETLLGGKAQKLESSLRTEAENIAANASKIGNSDIESAVWRSLGGGKSSHYGEAQLDMLGVASEAMALIEIANQRTNLPIVVIRKRHQLGFGSSSQSLSDVVTGSGYELIARDGQLDLEIIDAHRVLFETYQHVVYGGRRGLYGSAHHEHVWATPTKRLQGGRSARELKVEYSERFSVDEMIKNEYGSKALHPLEKLRKLATADNKNLWEQLEKTTAGYTGSAFSEMGDPRSDDDGKTAIYVGQDYKEVIASYSPTDHYGERFWVGGVQAALATLKSAEDTSRKAILVEKAAEIADTEDFYS